MVRLLASLIPLLKTLNVYERTRDTDSPPRAQNAHLEVGSEPGTRSPIGAMGDQGHLESLATCSARQEAAYTRHQDRPPKRTAKTHPCFHQISKRDRQEWKIQIWSETKATSAV